MDEWLDYLMGGDMGLLRRGSVVCVMGSLRLAIHVKQSTGNQTMHTNSLHI